MRLIFILLVSSSCFAQPKGANVIKITGVAFREVAQRLVDSGFFFQKIDSNYQILRTEFKEVNRYNVSYEVRVKDSVATITGLWESGNITFDIKNVKFSVYRDTFADLNKFALSFNKPVEYVIKK